MSPGRVTVGQLIDGGYSSLAGVYGLESAQDEHIRAFEGGQPVKQHAGVKQSARTMLDLQVKAGGYERALAALGIQCRNV